MNAVLHCVDPYLYGNCLASACCRALVQFLLNRGLLRRKDTSASSDSQKHSTAAGDAQVKAAGLGTTVVAQQEVQRLQAAYASMAAAFTANGLDLAAVAETAEWFDKGEWLSLACITVGAEEGVPSSSTSSICVFFSMA